jgi:NADH pyrophosphatase NudC (nudix superfamily)
MTHETDLSPEALELARAFDALMLVRPGAARAVAQSMRSLLANANAYVCPRCGTRSYHPTDKAEGYCARCHQFEAP